MGKCVVIVGTQWGDEGKGKITNYLSKKADYVVRYQGGNNAGHTIKFNNNTYKLQLIPSGIFNKKIFNVLGNGMVINPKHFLMEVNNLKQLGFDCTNLFISDRAQVLFDYHITLDGLKEQKLKEGLIGTTKKGIGPAYTDKIARIGIRMTDFVNENFYENLQKTLVFKNEELTLYNEKQIEIESFYKEYKEIAKEIKPYVIDSITLLNDAIKDNKNILFEGAQGALLDIDFGSYPFVTSSNPSGGGVCIGSGVGPTHINEVIGICKAYSTRVGSGVFPTEFEDDTAHYIRETGREYGTVTKRPRRIGWLDTVILNYSKMINGLTGISLMLLDVLSGIETIKICTSYLLNGKEIHTVPANIKEIEKCIPVYEELPGWTEDITKCKTYDELPTNAKNYIKRIENITSVPVVIVSVGPDEKETIIRKEIF